jgi:feruloyl esterase
MAFSVRHAGLFRRRRFRADSPRAADHALVSRCGNRLGFFSSRRSRRFRRATTGDRDAGILPRRCDPDPVCRFHIEMELWLPVSGWNGKFEAVRNGGWAGSINFGGMASALREGYATASTDTGHKSAETPGGSFALGHPEKLIDYGYRAIHEMTVKSKAILTAFYGREPRLSYWNGCSNGGRQGLMEAQRYPEDFAGIVAGAPAANWTGRAFQSLWVAQAAHKDDTSYIPPAVPPVTQRRAPGL